MQGVTQNVIKKSNSNLQVQALNNLVQVQPSKKFYTGAEVPFSSGTYKAGKSKPLKMGDFIRETRGLKKQSHNASYLTEQHNQSRENSHLKRSGTHRDSARGFSSSFTERKRSRDPFGNYLKNKQEDKIAMTETDEKPPDRGGFSFHQSRVPPLVSEPDEGTPLPKINKSKLQASPVELDIEDSDVEIKFPFEKKGEKSDKNRKVEFQKLPTIKTHRGSLFLVDGSAPKGQESKKQNQNQRLMVRPKNFKTGRSSHGNIANQKDDFREDLSHDSPHELRYTAVT